MPEICERINFKVHWYRLNKELRPVNLSETHACRAILAIHYFGFPQNLRPFKKYCENTGAILIEDAAHSFLSRDENGKELGHESDFCLFSFRKTLFIPNGAGLKVSKKWKTKVLQNSFLKTDSPASNKIWIMKKALINNLPEFAARLRKYVRPMSKRISELIPHNKIKPPFKGFLKALSELNTKKEIRRRKMAWEKFRCISEKTKIIPLHKNLPFNV